MKILFIRNVKFVLPVKISVIQNLYVLVIELHNDEVILILVSEISLKNNW